jgi:hypothetical protein
MNTDEAIRHLIYLGILERAVEPGGVDAWARIDRKIPGQDGWIIVPQEHDSYSPGPMPINISTVAEAIRRLQSSGTLEDLSCTDKFIDQVDEILDDSGPGAFPPAVSASILQIGLFGSIWY